jgi:cell envelope opacity-associated protein A
MAKPNFKFQKRQKELDKKKKNEEKMQRKLDKNSTQPAENPDQSQVVEETP